MIPEEKQFLVIDQTTDSSVGDLDEAFMATTQSRYQIHQPGSPGKLRRSPKTKSTCTQSTPQRLHPQLIRRRKPRSLRVAQELADIRGVVEERLQGDVRRRNSNTSFPKYPADA